MTAESDKRTADPNAVNRLLMSVVTETWSRTLRSFVILIGLALLVVAGAATTIIAGASIASRL
jgi:hypothetical protein